MLLTATPNPVPNDQAFDTIKGAIEAMPTGVKLFINSGNMLAYVLTSQSVADTVCRRVLRIPSPVGKLGLARRILREVS